MRCQSSRATAKLLCDGKVVVLLPVIDPRRACAARVTVLGSVCVC